MEMEGFVKVGSVGDLSRRRRMRVEIGSTGIVLFLVDGVVHAVLNRCPHQHFAMLHEGKLEGGEITCPMHGWTFDLATGEATRGSGKLKRFEVRCESEEIWIRVDEEGHS